MAPQSSGSFIPKKSPGAPVRSAPSGRIIGLFGYVSYAVFFGALLLSLGMFGLSYYIRSNLADQQAQLVAIQEDIDLGQIQELIEFDRYLRATEDVFEQSFSVLPVLQAFDQVIAEPVFLNTLNIGRNEDSLTVRGTAVADSFDATLFQRQVAESDSIVGSINIAEVVYIQDGSGTLSRFTGDQQGASASLAAISPEELVTFSFDVTIATQNLPFTLASYSTPARSVNLTPESVNEFSDDDSSTTEAASDTENESLPDDFFPLLE